MATSVFKAIFYIQGRFCTDSNSEKSDPMFSSERPSLSVRMLISQQLMSKQGGNTVQTPISVHKLQTVQDCIRPDVMANRLTAIQSLRRIQRSSASVQMTWQYRPNAIQCSTSNRVSISDTDMGRQLQSSGRCSIPVRTLSLIRQVVQKKFNRPDVKLHGPDTHTLLWKLCATEVQQSRR
jgi:hypothetical protein